MATGTNTRLLLRSMVLLLELSLVRTCFSSSSRWHHQVEEAHLKGPFEIMYQASLMP